MLEELKKLRSQFKATTDRIKGTDKKEAVEEYLHLTKRKTEIEAKIAIEKAKFYNAVAREKTKLARKKEDHEKFILGGLVKKYYAGILADEFEKKLVEMKRFDDEIATEIAKEQERTLLKNS